MRDNLRERIENLERGSNPIGTILMTFLTEENFLSQKSSDWVLCDGRSVANTKYHKIGLGENVPDCRGMFFRNSGEKAAPLGLSQGQATALNGITLSQKVSTEDVEFKTYMKRYDDATWQELKRDLVLCNYTWKKKDSGGPYKPDAPEDSGFLLNFYKKDKTVELVKCKNKEHTHKIETSLTGDYETRPSNITVNTFIRVN